MAKARVGEQEPGIVIEKIVCPMQNGDKNDSEAFCNFQLVFIFCS